MSENKKGCFLLGCGIVLALVLVVGGGIGIYMYSMYSKLKSYTSSQPADIPVYQASDQEIQSARAKAALLKKAFDEGKPVKVVLSAEDINTLIATEPKVSKDLAGKVAVKIDGDKIKVEGSVPLKDAPIMQDRYLNGEFTLDVSMDNGILIVKVDKASANGKPIPEEFMEGFRSKNLASKLYEDPKMAEKIRKLKTIKVQDGQLIVETQAQGN